MRDRTKWMVAAGALAGVVAGRAIISRVRALDLNGRVVLITGGSRGAHPEAPDPPVPPGRDVPPIEEPPDNPDVQPNAPVREPEPPGPTRL
jgi:hypothetical protein